MCITTGPTNTMITIYGIKFGFNKTIHHIFEIAVGDASNSSIILIEFVMKFKKAPLIKKAIEYFFAILLIMTGIYLALN